MRWLVCIQLSSIDPLGVIVELLGSDTDISQAGRPTEPGYLRSVSSLIGTGVTFLLVTNYDFSISEKHGKDG